MLETHYLHKYRPIIKAIIVETINKPDMEIQLALRAAYPDHRSNLVAVKAWENSVRDLREQFYKKQKGNKNTW